MMKYFADIVMGIVFVGILVYLGVYTGLSYAHGWHEVSILKLIIAFLIVLVLGIGGYALVRIADSAAGSLGDHYEAFALIVYGLFWVFVAVVLLPPSAITEMRDMFSPFSNPLLTKPQAITRDEPDGKMTQLTIPTTEAPGAKKIIVHLVIEPDKASTGVLIPKEGVQQRTVWYETDTFQSKTDGF